MLLKRIIQGILTGCLLFGVGTAIFHNYQKVIPYLRKDFLTYNLGPVDHKRVQAKAITGSLNHIMPELEYLFKLLDGEVASDHKKIQESVEYYYQIIRFFPQHADAYAMLGNCYYILEDKVKAAAFYRKALEFNPVSFWAWYDLGVIAFEQGNYPVAISVLEAALKLNPAMVIKAINSSLIYRGIQQRLGGDFLVSDSLHEGYQQSYKMMVLSYYYMKDFEKMWQTALSGIKDFPSDKDFFSFYAGLAAYHKGEYPHAISFFQEVIKDNPRNADAFVYLGQSLRKTGQNLVASGMLKKAVALQQTRQAVVLPGIEVRVRIF